MGIEQCDVPEAFYDRVMSSPQAADAARVFSPFPPGVDGISPGRATIEQLSVWRFTQWPGSVPLGERVRRSRQVSQFPRISRSGMKIGRLFPRRSRSARRVPLHWYVTRIATPSSENVRAVDEATLAMRTLKALLAN